MPFNIWTSGSLIFGRSSSLDAVSKFKFSMSGMSASLDTSIFPQVKVGFSVGFSAVTTSIGEQGSQNMAQTMTGRFYASWRAWDRFFIDGIAAMGARNRSPPALTPTQATSFPAIGRGTWSSAPSP
jgi:hypothetical protein